jgi:hypothetical protein
MRRDSLSSETSLNLSTLSKDSWLLPPETSEQEAEALLSSAEQDCFLVRVNSAIPNTYALSAITNRQIKHRVIKPQVTPEGMAAFVVEPSSNAISYLSLGELVVGLPELQGHVPVLLANRKK